MDFAQLSLLHNLAAFGAAALVIAVGGVLITGYADKIADRTGLGEAVIGGVLLGASTSLSGTVTSVSAAISDHPDLAVSNAIGGIAVQTLFLAIADITYRRANLEHAAASATNLIQASLLVVMLSLALLAVYLPPFAIAGLHPASIALLIAYGFGLRLVAGTKDSAMWVPLMTADTRRDVQEERSGRGPATHGLFLLFAIVALAVGISGWVIAETGAVIAARTQLSQSVVGALLTATATSLPELVTTLAAVRRGALQLAVGGIIGGNTFDVLFLVLSDAAYRPGSIYHAVDAGYVYWLALSLLMTGVLLLGLLKRERHGVANIGFESMLLVAIYICGMLVAALSL